MLCMKARLQWSNPEAFLDSNDKREYDIQAV